MQENTQKRKSRRILNLQKKYEVTVFERLQHYIRTLGQVLAQLLLVHFYSYTFYCFGAVKKMTQFVYDNKL